MSLTISGKAIHTIKGPNAVQFYHGHPELIMCTYSTGPNTDIFDCLPEEIASHFTFKPTMLSTRQIIKYYTHFTELLQKDEGNDRYLESYSKPLCFFQDCLQPLGKRYSEVYSEIEDLCNQFGKLAEEYSKRLKTEGDKVFSEFLRILSESGSLLWFHYWYVEKWMYIKALKIVKKEKKRYTVIHSYFRHVFSARFPGSLGYSNMVGVYESDGKITIDGCGVCVKIY